MVSAYCDDPSWMRISMMVGLAGKTYGSGVSPKKKAWRHS